MIDKTALILYSGGMGSFLSAYYLITNKIYRDYLLYFNDTFMESDHLYLFLLNTLNCFEPCGKEDFNGLYKLCKTIPSLKEEEKRKQHLFFYGKMLHRTFTIFEYDPDGRNIYEVFEGGLMGNSRVDPCSKYLKRERSQVFVRSKYKPEEVDVFFGIDYTEYHRLKRAKKYWKPYNIKSILVEKDIDIIKYEEEVFSNLPFNRSLSYDLEFSHDNCGGFCVKTGMASFKNLLEKRPETYNYHMLKEEETYEKIGRFPFLRKMIDGQDYYITLREFKEWLETGISRCEDQIILNDNISEEELLEYGGCGCAL